MLLLLFFSVFASRHTQSPVVVESVEVNTCYDENMRVMFTQVIIWEWDDAVKSDVVCQYFMVAEGDIAIARGREFHTIGFYDVHLKREIVLKTRVFRFTRTYHQFDPERLNRAILCERDRVPVICR